MSNFENPSLFICFPTVQLETKVKRLEMNLQATEAKLHITDQQLVAKRAELDEFKEKCGAKDYAQV